MYNQIQELFELGSSQVGRLEQSIQDFVRWGKETAQIMLDDYVFRNHANSVCQQAERIKVLERELKQLCQLAEKSSTGGVTAEELVHRA